MKETVKPIVRAVLAAGILGSIIGMVYCGISVPDGLWAVGGSAATFYFVGKDS